MRGLFLIVAIVGDSDYRGQITHELCTNYARIYEWVNNFENGVL